MHLYRTKQGVLLQNSGVYYAIQGPWDSLINQPALHGYLAEKIAGASALDDTTAARWLTQILAPLGSQEVWAAGVTYVRSRDARMDESKGSGVADVYQRVYEAARPELFFKATPQRVAHPGAAVYIREDSTWNVPEPELVLFINSAGNIQAYTIGNDMSSRSIEGENPLYLPQAKIYEGSCAIGPCLYVPAAPISSDTLMRLAIRRNDSIVFDGSIQLNRMKRSLDELAQWLYRGCNFPVGCFLFTGTGLVPPNDFTLAAGDEVAVSIEGIGELNNRVQILP